MRSGASRDAFPSGAWERHRFNGGAVAVCFEGCCGSMCWPRERPATHAAAGAAARGVRGIGGFFHTLGAWERHRIVSSAPPRCVLRSGASHSLQWGGMPAWRRRFRNDDGLGVVAVCSEGGCRREGLTTGVVRHACRHRVTARGVFGLGDSFTRPGAASHACRRRSGCTRS